MIGSNTFLSVTDALGRDKYAVDERSNRGRESSGLDVGR